MKCAKCGSPITVSHNHKNKDGSIIYVYVCTGRKTYGVDYCDTKQIKQSILDDKFIKSLKNYANMDFDTFNKCSKALFNKS
ncbi:recombinase zinc beta ribbon domain-containing protein [Clostridium pasteurianum]|uniref:recombinase zinc beta ribbon domain-containing protein n=1 Tax=Clostridium pasteurianum TaxID=1501 RepID=UPI00039A2838